MLWQFPLRGHLLHVSFVSKNSGIVKVIKINIPDASKIW